MTRAEQLHFSMVVAVAVMLLAGLLATGALALDQGAVALALLVLAVAAGLTAVILAVLLGRALGGRALDLELALEPGQETAQELQNRAMATETATTPIPARLDALVKAQQGSPVEKAGRNEPAER
jgi:hypothetical protein